MKARIVRIGNSRGVRLPKPLIEEAGLPEEVEIQARDGAIIIVAATRPRAGWREAAQLLRKRKDDILLEPETRTQFDEKEWRW
jgi:antitoxin MazE